MPTSVSQYKENKISPRKWEGKKGEIKPALITHTSGHTKTDSVQANPNKQRGEKRPTSACTGNRAVESRVPTFM